MSRSGYNDYDGDYSELMNINWRGAVKSAMRGKRGQAFLKEMLTAFDAMPEKRLIKNDLAKDGAVCALGAVAVARKIDVSNVDPEDHDTVAGTFGIAHAMACEIMYYNDEFFYSDKETPEQRWERMRAWIASQIKDQA
jgi:hypothetical protein